MNNHLEISLSCAVPLWILQIKGRGGPSEDDFARMSDVSQLIAEHGDLLLFGSQASKKGSKGTGKNKIQTADVFNRTAEAIAIMSFLPGGITIFGQHFETKGGTQ